MSVQEFIIRSLQEDVGNGDHTSLACISENARGKAVLKVKEPCILSGVDVAGEVLTVTDTGLKMNRFKNDGDQVQPGDVAFEISGSSRSILKCERLMLNIMQRMSGIATLTSKYVDQCGGTRAQILDTRKTTPGFRLFEKQAVKTGGGHNHRFGLFDYIMIKDNHIDYAGGITQALENTQNYLNDKGLSLGIEIEARNISEVEEIMKSTIADRIMLDNFSIADTRKAVTMIGNLFETEASGGITLDTVRDHALCGVDFISVGALTHSSVSVDLSLKAV